MDKARNSFFTPHWLSDGELFWYRKELPNGHEDVVIDAATGKPTTRFDAVELARQVQAVYASETAPTDVLMAPDGGSGVASRGGNLWLVPAADTGAARAQRLTPPVETYWAPNSRIVLVSYTDQQQIAPYPYIERARHQNLPRQDRPCRTDRGLV